MKRDSLDLVELGHLHRRMRRFALALVGDEHGAEDLVQEAWLRMLESGPREPRAARAWLAQVARRLASNVRRAGRRRDAREAAAARPEAAPSSADVLARIELEARVLAALDELAEPHRTLLRDRYLGEISPAQLAARDGLSVDAVKARLARARAALRAKLEREGLGDEVHWTSALAPLLTHLGAPPLPPATVVVEVQGVAGAGSIATHLGPLTVGGLLMLKKVTLATVALVIAVGTWKRIERNPTEPLVQTERGPLAPIAPVELRGPTSNDGVAFLEVPEATTRTTERVDESAANAATWTLTGRARPASKQARIAGLDVHLALHAGYSAQGPVLWSGDCVTDDDGRFHGECAAPSVTTTLEVSVAPLEGNKVSSSGPQLCVRGEGPPDPIDILVVPLDVEVRGRVTDERGLPLAGARVVSHVGPTTETDGRGQYSVRASSAGWKDLSVSAPGYGPVRRHLEGLIPEGVVSLDFELVPGAELHGRVVDPNGAPVAGATVNAQRKLGGSATTDSNGRFQLRSIEVEGAKRFSVYVEAAGYVSAVQWIDTPAAGERIETEFRLESGAAISGRVVDSTGVAVAGAEVWIGVSEHAWDRGVTRSDDDGRFAFEHVGTGSVHLGANKRGFAALKQEVTLDSDAPLTGVELRLSTGRSIQGRVENPQGIPVSGAIVVASLPDGTTVGDSTRSDADGAFELRSLPENDLVVETYLKGWTRDRQHIAKDKDVMLLTLAPAGRLFGRVVDAATGAPLERFSVRIHWPTDPSLVPAIKSIGAAWVDPGKSFASADGTWSTDAFEELEVGAWARVAISAPGYATTTLDGAQVSASDTDEGLLHLLVPPIALQVALVSKADHAPVSAASVRLTAAPRPQFDVDEVWRGATDSAGIAIFEGLSPGALYAHIEREGAPPATFGPYELLAAASRGTWTIELPAGTSVAVHLTDLAGEPLVGCGVELRAEDVAALPAGGKSEARAGGDGVARWHGVLPGRWQVGRVVEGPAGTYCDVLTSFVVAPGAEQVDVDLRPAGSATLRGRVHSEVASPADARVTVLPARDGPTLVAPLRDGAFEVVGLAPGEYSVTLQFWNRGDSRPTTGAAVVTVAIGQAEVEVTLYAAQR